MECVECRVWSAECGVRSLKCGVRTVLCEIQFIMKVDGILARNINFEVANFQVLRETRRKTSILKF